MTTRLPLFLASIPSFCLSITVAVSCCISSLNPAVAQLNDTSRVPFSKPPNLEVMSKQQWAQVDDSVDRALSWLATRQSRDGSIPTNYAGQPGVTSLVTLAFLSHGEQAGNGEYGEFINRSIDYVLKCQRKDDVFVVDSTDTPIPPFERGSHTALYNHAITCLMLSEAYGSINPEREPKVREALERGLKLARKMQQRKQLYPEDRGGFRYFKPTNNFANMGDADLSVTGWFIMFFRSAKNAGFDVPQEYVEDAIKFVNNCYDPKLKGFYYSTHGHGHEGVARGMTGAGIVCLSAAGKPNLDIAHNAAQWIIDHPFDEFGGTTEGAFYDRFFYSAYYCSQAMVLLGGDYWGDFYPTMARTMIEGQNEDGSWPLEGIHNDGKFGSEYSTALTVLSLTAPFEMLPIHQR